MNGSSRPRSGREPTHFYPGYGYVVAFDERERLRRRQSPRTTPSARMAAIQERDRQYDTGAYQESIAEPAGQAWSRAEDADHVTHQAAACRTSAMLAVQNINREARARRKRISQAQRQASEGIRQDSERERFLRALFAHNAARRQVRPPPGFEFSHPLASKAIPIMSDQEIEEICKNIRNFAITDSHDGECDGENCTCEGCIVARIAMAMSTTNE